MSKKLFILTCIVALMILLTSACSSTAEEPDELLEIRLPMGYIADPQYSPYYVAVEKGYFAAEGLSIEFDYSFETDGVALVGANELPFAVVSGDQVLLARAQGVPVVYVMEWFQRFPIAVIAKADSGIESAADLRGRTVGLPGFFGASYFGYRGLLAANDIGLEEIQNNDIGFTQVESLLTDQVEAVVGYANNEPVQLAAQNVDVNVINVADSIDLVANGIITNETILAENPELVEGFVRALLRGQADTLADPEEAFEISRNFVPELDDGRMAVLQASLPMWEAEQPGITSAESWENTMEILLSAGLLDAPLDDLDAAFTNEIVLRVQP